MNNNTKLILGLVLVILIVLAISLKKDAAPVPDEQQNVVIENVEGCYVATLAKDVYTLNVQSQSGESIDGKLVFKNFEKDSSSGDFKGTYKDGMLFGNYTFNSEGSDSVLNVIFKRVGADFVRGYGDMNATGDTFLDINKVTYDSSVVFRKTEGPCATSL